MDSVDKVYDAAIRNGAESVRKPQTMKDKSGRVRLATIKTYGDTCHTLVERKAYSGTFLPGFRDATATKDPLSTHLPAVKLQAIDHCVGNTEWNEMDDTCE